MSRIFGYLAVAGIAWCGPVSAQPPDKPTSPAAEVASRSDPRGPLIQVRTAGGGRCEYRWDGRAVAESNLLETAVRHLEGTIRRLGGVEHVTAANFPAANFQSGENTPYRCVRPALEAIVSVGFMELRIADPNPAAPARARPLVFELHPDEEPEPSLDPVRNRVRLDERGVLRWNGDEIDLVTLREYCDVTQTMNPIPWLELEIAERAHYREVGALLGVLWRAGVQQIRMTGPNGKPDALGSGLRLSASGIVR